MGFVCAITLTSESMFATEIESAESLADLGIANAYSRAKVFGEGAPFGCGIMDVPKLRFGFALVRISYSLAGARYKNNFPDKKSSLSSRSELFQEYTLLFGFENSV